MPMPIRIFDRPANPEGIDARTIFPLDREEVAQFRVKTDGGRANVPILTLKVPHGGAGAHLARRRETGRASLRQSPVWQKLLRRLRCEAQCADFSEGYNVFSTTNVKSSASTVVCRNWMTEA